MLATLPGAGRPRQRDAGVRRDAADLSLFSPPSPRRRPGPARLSAVAGVPVPAPLQRLHRPGDRDGQALLMPGVVRLALAPGPRGPDGPSRLDPGHLLFGIRRRPVRWPRNSTTNPSGRPSSVAAVSPAFLFMRGLPDGTGIGAVVFFQGYAFTAVLAGLMSTFLVIRHTRTDEELGAEIVGAARSPGPHPWRRRCCWAPRTWCWLCAWPRVSPPPGCPARARSRPGRPLVPWGFSSWPSPRWSPRSCLRGGRQRCGRGPGRLQRISSAVSAMLSAPPAPI